MSHSRAFRFQAPSLRRGKSKGKSLLSIPLSISSLHPLTFLCCQCDLLDASLLVWALVTRGAAPDIPVRSTEACSPQTQLLPDAHPILTYLFWVWGCLGYEGTVSGTSNRPAPAQPCGADSKEQGPKADLLVVPTNRSALLPHQLPRAQNSTLLHPVIQLVPACAGHGPGV